MAYNDIQIDPVQSSWIKEFIRADNDILMRLRSGHQMIIRNVPDGVYTNWLRSKSKGQYFHQVIKVAFQVDTG